jgi:hypothetical protein
MGEEEDKREEKRKEKKQRIAEREGGKGHTWLPHLA